MSKRQLLCILGVWVMIFLFLGVRSSWQKGIAIVTGLLIIVISYNIVPAEKSNKSGENKETFIENNHQ